MASRKDDQLEVFGSDYETPDGTCIRDYVHVSDLARAHMQALNFIEANDGAHAFNLGNGKGFSVLEMIRAAGAVTGQAIAYRIRPRRAGDPPALVASSDLARTALGWEPAHTDIGQIIASAWHRHKNARY